LLNAILAEKVSFVEGRKWVKNINENDSFRAKKPGCMYRARYVDPLPGPAL
jgi:hypothetical protein